MTATTPSWAQLEGRLQAPLRGRASTWTAGRRSMRRFAALVFLSDCLVVIGSLGVATIVRFGVHDAALDVAGMLVSYWAVVALVAVTWIIALTAYRTRDLKFIGSGSSEYRRVTNATAMLFGLVAIMLLALGADISRMLFLVAFPLGLGGLLVSRRLWRGWLIRNRRKGRYTVGTVIVGPRRDVRRVLTTLVALPGLSYQPVGVMLEGHQDDDELVAAGRRFPIFGGTSSTDIADQARTRGIDAVIVAGQPKGRDFLRNLGWELERTDAELLIASRLANVAGPRIHIRPVESLPLMHVELPNYEGGKHLLKRALDVVASALGLIVLAPLFIAIAIAVKTGDGGPVLFRQPRVGRNGSRFQMIKFRSMVPDAESALAALATLSDGNGVLFKLRDDPRVTPIGRILRKYSLDELPQLFNVLTGEMSLVGPRPPLIDEVDKYEQHVMRRLYIKPGLTGMWQISGRSDLSWEESVRLDLYYVENWSLTGDLLILWRTVKVILRPRGAY